MALHWATPACQWRYTELHVHVIGVHVNKGTHLDLFGHDLLSLKPLSDFLQLVLLLLDLSLQFHFHTLMFSNLHPHLFNLATILLGRALRCREVILNQSSTQVSSLKTWSLQCIYQIQKQWNTKWQYWWLLIIYFYWVKKWTFPLVFQCIHSMLKTLIFLRT